MSGHYYFATATAPPFNPSYVETPPNNSVLSHLTERNTVWKSIQGTAKAAKLVEIWAAMEPCIRKCVIAKLDPGGLLQNYQTIYMQCRCIVEKNMRLQKFQNIPPCAFSEAVHAYVMSNQAFYNNKTWRFVSAFFEYTCMEIAAEQALAEQRAGDWVQRGRWPAASSANGSWWAWAAQRRGELNHGELLQQTHAKVHDTHEKLDDILNQLREILENRQNS